MPVNMTLMIESEMKVALDLVLDFLGIEEEAEEGSFFWRLAFGAEEREGSRSSSNCSVLGLGLFPLVVVDPVDPVFPLLDPVFVTGIDEEMALESMGARAGREEGRERGVDDSESVSLGVDLEGSFCVRGS